MKPSVASSSTRCDCSVFLRRSGICAERGDFDNEPLAQQPAISSIIISSLGSAIAIVERPFFALQRNEVVAEHQVDRHGPEQFVMDFFRVDEVAAVAARQVLRLRCASC